MLRIRLQRTGNKNNTTFRLVVTEKSNSAKGKVLEFLGHYLPMRDPAVFEFDQKRIEYYIGNGAVPTDTVARLLSKKDVKGMEKYMEQYSKKKKKKEVEEKPEPAAPAAAAAEVPQEAKEADEASEAKKEDDKKEGDS